MQRVAFLIRVKPEKLDEYKKLHSPIWPELTAELAASGIRNYSLWLRDDGVEFGYLECDDWEQSCACLAKSEVHDRWQALMQNYLDSATDAGQGGQPIELLTTCFQILE